MAGTRKILITIFISCFLPALFSPVKVRASSLPPDSAGFFSEVSDILPNKPKANPIAACMDFAEAGFGQISLGIRTGLCALFDPGGSIGYGYGAQIRIRLAKRWNLELYTDYFKTPIMKLGYHTDLRFGGSILYYWVKRPFRIHKFTPFVLAGISTENNVIHSYVINTSQQLQGWVAWFNIGYGEHYNFSKRVDLTIEGIYVVPLASHPVSFLATQNNIEFLNAKTEPGFNVGGVFVILSLNYAFGNMQ